MKDTVNAGRPQLDKLIVDIIQGQSEFKPEGTDFDSVVVALQTNWEHGEPPTREKILNMTEILFRKLLIKRQSNGHYVATNLDQVAADLGVTDFIKKL